MEATRTIKFDEFGLVIPSPFNLLGKSYQESACIIESRKKIDYYDYILCNRSLYKYIKDFNKREVFCLLENGEVLEQRITK